jgi:hypothetical protein
MTNITNFLYNFFSIFIDLYKINFGYLYNLNIFNKENKDNIDMSFFIEIEIYLFRFFNLFKKNYLNDIILKYLNTNNNSFLYNNFLGKIAIDINSLNKYKKVIKKI